MNALRDPHPDDRAIRWLRGSDPLGADTTSGWARGPEGVEVLEGIVSSDPSVSADPLTPRRRHVRPLILAAALLVLGAGVAGAGALLGRPAPEAVRHDLAGVDQGMPPDLRLDPDVRDARLVATADGAQLYAATLADGGVCTEIVDLDGRPSGAVCATAAELGTMPISVTVPFVDPITLASPIVVGGRVNATGATSLEAVYGDGARRTVTLEAGGYYLFVVPTDVLASAHRRGLELVASAPDGAQVATADVPATDFADPEASDAREPIFVSTISTHRDYTLVLGIEGSVNVPGARTLELRYPDGSTADVPLDADGDYRFRLPAARRDDLASAPGTLIAHDADGDVIARRSVASVAYWRGHV